MNIQEERHYILDENDTAQQTLIDLLEGMKPDNTRELNIAIPLSGDLDFSILGTMGFKRVKSIHLAEGKVTSILHVPKTVTELICEGNIMIALENLPSSLVRINCSRNHISQLRIGNLDNLEYLNCENNDLVELKDIPESMEELYCDNNAITKLNLSGLDRLKTLHCSNNKLMVLQNLPTTLIDFKMENNPLGVVEHEAHSNKKEEKAHEAETDAKIGYVESLGEYFRLKEKYDTKAHTMRRNAFRAAPNKRIGKMRVAKVRPPCVNCKRPVGSIFAKVDEKYIARCGDKDSPCELNIQLFTSDFYRPEELLNSYREIVEEAKENIIRQKLDTLFSYVSEANAAKLFKPEFHKYTEASKMYSDFLEEYKQTYDNAHKKELIVRKNQEIQEQIEASREMLEEFKKTENRKIINTMIQSYIDDLIPKIETARQMKYPVMEMVEEGGDIQRLVQRDVPITKYDYSYTEPPKVIQFRTKSDDI